jgi:protease I
MSESLQGLRIALLAADGVGQIELEASGDAVRRAGAHTQLLSLRTGHIQSLDNALDPGPTYTVDQTVAQATAAEYEALLLVPGVGKSARLSSDNLVVAFVRDFITAGKPVGIVCYGAWTLLEAGVARGHSLPLSVTMRARRQTGASVLSPELVSPRELGAFYSTIVGEFARLIRQPAPASAEGTEQEWARVAVFPPRPGCEKHSAATKVAGS